MRPLQSIVATFGPETENPETVPFSVDGIAAGTTTRGHRFLAPEPFEVRRFDDYVQALERAHVILDADRRKDIILHDARDLAFARGLDLVEDDGLLEEVAGLVEWPVVLMGSFDERFLEIPSEAIRATIRANQKCFVLRKSGTEELAPAFLLVSNLVASDGGAAITAGNERVVRARLSDARFFFETDKATKLEDRLPKLDSIVFHEKLGTQGERIARIAALAKEIAPLVGADSALAERAARLAKADLVTEMVGEFPELQGLMGRKYAALQGEHPSVAAAIEEHYKPVGPSDRVPTDPVSIAVALADKLDTLVGFWAIDEKPTGSKDPFALRRAALGIIRIILENTININIQETWKCHVLRSLSFENDDIYDQIINIKDLDFIQDQYKILKETKPYGIASLILKAEGSYGRYIDIFESKPADLTHEIGNLDKAVLSIFDDIQMYIIDETQVRRGDGHYIDRDEQERLRDQFLNLTSHLWDSASLFFADRLKVYLRDQGVRHDLIDAVFALPGQDDLLLVVRRVEALGAFLGTDDGKNLLAGYKRAANILRIEEKKDGRAYDAAPDAACAAAGQPEERALVEALDAARAEASAAVAAEDFAGAMRALSRLRAPVDAFFETVTVNADDPALRENRLLLLNALRAATREVADFSRIEG